MCKPKYSSFQSDDLVDMISTTVRKMNKSGDDLRRQVLLNSVGKTLKSELGRKQRKLRRNYQVIMSQIYAKRAESVPETPEETQDDLLDLDDFFSSLKSVNSASDYHK
ncbi:hypothetical protein JTE90_010539 [Oedothorax gibbosus]|uniref:Uncharacterized protein n=1 Tax=Oedothorax gibbosus TaxID=931172 RepID=A0AAV6TPN6_9ARAC|nr:hypothetical protein JTE90_010539 [Oedothorax gibbosus]